MKIKIGQYTISQRTEYSKIVVTDDETNKNLTRENKKIANKILESYKSQSSAPEDFFNIESNTVWCFNDDVDEDSVKYLFIPEGVEEISDYAFETCSFKCVSFPSTLISIGAQAFYACDVLKYMDIPDTVKTIGMGAFESCSNLKRIKLPSNLESLEDESFCCCDSLKEIDIPDSVKSIGINTFNGCCALKKVKLPKDLTVLKKGAFCQCINLRKVIFSDSLKKIGKFAFCESGLESVDIPDSVEDIDKMAFENCSYLENVKLPKNLERVSGKLFSGCSSLKQVILPDNISILEDEIFKDTQELMNINIPRNLDCICGAPFANSSIESILFKHDLEELEITSSKNREYDLLTGSIIDKLIIDSNVRTIDPNAFKVSGHRVTKIDFLGSEPEFIKFKTNNKFLFDNYLTNVDDINYIEKDKGKYLEDISR